MTPTNPPIPEPSTDLPHFVDTPSACRLSEWGLLRVSGEDAAGFLQGQATCDINALGDGRLGSGAFCTPKGRVIASFRIAKSGDAFYLLLANELVPVIHKRLQLYVLRSRVILENLSEKYILIGVMGSGAETALDITDHALRRSQGLSWFNDRGYGILKVSEDPARYLLLIDTIRSWSEERFGQLPLLKPEVWKWCEIEAGFPWVTAATSEEFLPQMLNLDCLDGIGFKKGCYTGQEIVTRTHFLGQLKRRMFRLSCKSDSPVEAGAVVYAELDGESKTAGQIVNACRNKEGDIECLAVLSLELADSPKLRAADPQQGPLLQKLSLPYSLAL
jgi:folate-binding protein YgfZ